jgi:hypothetical protein
MNKLTSYLLLLLLLVGSGTAWAADALRFVPFNIEPGQTKSASLALTNGASYSAFQLDLTLPAGVSLTDGSASLALTGRAKESHQLISRRQADGAWRIVCFSTGNEPFADTEGALLTLGLTAAADFAGGTATLANILFVDESMRDVALAEQTLAVGAHEQNALRLTDGQVDAGGQTRLALVLTHESRVSGFEADILLPDSITAVAGTWLAVNDAFAVTATAVEGGVHVSCRASGDAAIAAGSADTLVTFAVEAERRAIGPKTLSLANIVLGRPSLTDDKLADVSATLTVRRIFVSGITLSANELTLKPNRTAKLEATVAPDDATLPELIWTSSADSVATVAPDGTVTSVYDGEAIITALATDGSGVKAECRVTVVPPTPGDANDDDRLTVSDAVAIANYIVGNVNSGFNLRAADANGDGAVTIADAVVTIDLVLKQPAADDVTGSFSTTSTAGAVATSGTLVIEDFEVHGGKATVGVRLTGNASLTALQADLRLPEGLRLTEVAASPASDHAALAAQLEDAKDTYRLVLFSPESRLLPTGQDLVATLTVETDDSYADSELRAAGVIASDLTATDRRLASEAGFGKLVTGLRGVAASALTAFSADGAVIVRGAEGREVSVYDINGALLRRSTASRFELPQGVYVVRVGEWSARVVNN